MSQTAPSAAERADRRGTPPGRGVIVRPNGGRIGNPPFVPTEEQRALVRQFAKVVPIDGEHHIAAKLGISRHTLRRHFANDMAVGRADAVLAIGTQFLNRAIDVNAKGPDGQLLAKGDPDAQKFFLARIAKWSSKTELSGPDGGPIRTFDLSSLSDDDKRALIPVINQLLASQPEDGEYEEVEDDDEAADGPA